jgi:predicted acyl esterase
VISHRAQTGADPNRVGAVGYSQGGGTTNLIGARDHRVKVLAPGQTFAGLSESLHPNGCTKLTVASTILGAAYTAQGARLDPTLTVPWSAYLGTGIGGDAAEAQWTVRSPETYADRTTQPTLWVQAFDDPLFPIDQALRMQRLRRGSDFRLWLSWGGHFAAATGTAELTAREDAWQGWLAHTLQGKDTPAAHLPRVTWWYRAADGHTLVRRSSPSWPPPGVRTTKLALPAGSVVAVGRGLADDPIVRWGQRTLGTPDQVGQAVGAVPPTSSADTLVMTGPALPARTLVAGAPRADINWSSTAADSQLDVKLYDVAPDGSGTLLSYGCTAVHGAGPRRVRLSLAHTAIEVPAGHRLAVWVQGSDAPTWLPAQQPAVDTLGPGSRLLVPVLPQPRARRVSAATASR